MSDSIPVDLDAVLNARRRLERALELITTIHTAGVELANLVGDDQPIISIGAGAPPQSAPDTPTPPPDTTLEQAEAPTAPPAGAEPAQAPPARAGAGRGRKPGAGRTIDRIPDALRELDGAAILPAIAEHLGVSASAVRQALRKNGGPPAGVRYTPGSGHGRPGILELDAAEPDAARAFDDTRRAITEQPFPANITPSLPRPERPPRPNVDPPPMSARTRRALDAEQNGATATVERVPVLERNIVNALAAFGPDTIRGLAVRLRPTDRGAIADTIMRLVAAGTLHTAGRETTGGDVLYKLA